MKKNNDKSLAYIKNIRSADEVLIREDCRACNPGCFEDCNICTLRRGW